MKNKKNFITSELTDKNDYKKYILKVKNISLRRIIFVQVHYCATVILSISYLVSRWILFKKKLMNKRFIVLRLCFLLISITIITNLATIYFFDIISITFKKRSMKYFCINYTRNKSYAKIDIIIRKIFNKMQK